MAPAPKTVEVLTAAVGDACLSVVELEVQGEILIISRDPWWKEKKAILIVLARPVTRGNSDY